MFKRILSLILSLVILGSTTVYAIEEPQEAANNDSIETQAAATLIITHEEKNEASDTDSDKTEDNETVPSDDKKESVEKTEEPSEKNTEEPLNAEEEKSEEELSDGFSKQSEYAEDAYNDSTDNNTSEQTELSENYAEGKTENTDVSADNLQKSSVNISELAYSNKSLSFYFDSEDDETIYSAHLLGCTFELDNNHYNGNTEETIEKRLEHVAEEIARQFYSNGSFSINDSESFETTYGLIPYIIDAEKQNLEDGSADDMLCWAASSSDMLKYADWELQDNTTETILTVDQMYDYFVDDYYSRGADQETGLKWFLNGINAQQEIDSDGDVKYEDDADKWAQEKSDIISPWKSENWNGFYSDNPAEDVIKYYGSTEINEFGDTVEELDKGNAVGLGVSTVDSSGKYIGDGHAITLFGYIKSIAESGLNALKAIFFADSDNNAQCYDPSYNIGEHGVVDKKDIIDSVTMYTVSPKQYYTESGDVTETYDSISIDGYSTNSEKTYVLRSFTTLENRETYYQRISGETAESGSKNAKTDVDMITNSYNTYDDDCSQIITEAYTGDTVKLRASITNMSYAKIDYSKNPYLIVRIHIYREGNTEEYDSKDINVLLEDYNWQQQPDLLPTKRLTLTSAYTFTESGNYTFMVDIIGIQNEDGTYVTEAYVNNNYYFPKATMTISDYIPYYPEEDDDEKIPEYSTSYVQSSSLPLEIRIFPDDIGNIDISTLVFKYHGVVLDKSMYTLEKCADGSYSLIIKAEFLKSLAAGEQIIEIFDANGELLVIISISIA